MNSIIGCGPLVLRFGFAASNHVPKMSLRGGNAAGPAGRIVCGPCGPLTPRHRAVDAQPRAGLQHFGRDAVARELRVTVRFAHILVRPAVLVDSRDVQVAMGIARLVFRDDAFDIRRFVDVEVRREAVMSEHCGCGEACDEQRGGGFVHCDSSPPNEPSIKPLRSRWAPDFASVLR
jgi:hypothetical protein